MFFFPPVRNLFVARGLLMENNLFHIYLTIPVPFSDMTLGN